MPLEGLAGGPWHIYRAMRRPDAPKVELCGRPSIDRSGRLRMPYVRIRMPRAASAKRARAENTAHAAHRRQRIHALHPDKLGRDHTPGERAEFVRLTGRRPK